MSVTFDFDLDEEEVRRMASIPAESWFTAVRFRNVQSPRHPEADSLDRNHVLKRELLFPWVRSSVRGKRVLDLFCANGAFSFEAALSGASEVVGLESSEDRVRCADFLAQVFQKRNHCDMRFMVGNVYDLTHIFRQPFDVVLCFGGLYHVADPCYVLDQINALTKEQLIIQTSQIISGRGTRGEFKLRKDATGRGMTSLIGNRGTWHLSVPCFENMLKHSRFEILEARRPPIWLRKRFPWYCALAHPLRAA
jgi:2-polyprenyl-3-methyl-5-hydroxy-6-metoxy-1,4-benzoquinol methylase